MYVYRFIDTTGKVIYIGKTINIHNRMKQHFKNGHLPLECYKSVSRIEYQKYRTESDSLIMETYYITKYNPRYNQLQKSRDIPCIEFDETDSNTLIGKGQDLQNITVKGRCKIKNSEGVTEVQTFYIDEDQIEEILKPYEK